MKTTPKIAILGGGIGGLVCASELNYRLGTKAEITLFDKSPDHVYQPAFLHLALGQRKPEKIRRPLERLKKQGVNFLNGEVFRADPKNLVVNAEHGDFEFDYLIFALGAGLNPRAIEGFEENALNLYSQDGAMQIYQALKNFEQGKIVIAISSMPFKCPAAPYEMAFLIDNYLRRNNKRSNAELTIVSPEPFPFPVAGKTVGQKVIKLLGMAGIEYLPNESIKSVGKQISLAKKRFKADLIIGVPAHKCPDVAVDGGLAPKDGWISVDKNNLSTKFKNLYAIGDSTVIPLANGKALPKAGVFAKAQAEVVAFNLAHKVLGNQAQEKSFQGIGACFLEVANKKAAYAKGNFFHEPDPLIKMKDPSRIYYAFKMLYEKYWRYAWI